MTRTRLVMLMLFACALGGLATAVDVVRAQDSPTNSGCYQLGDSKNAWICPVPESTKIKCSGPVDDLLLCNRPIGEPVQNVNVTKPSNCGVNKKGKYICW